MSVDRNVICWRRLTGLFPSDTPGCDRSGWRVVHQRIGISVAIGVQNIKKSPTSLNMTRHLLYVYFRLRMEHCSDCIVLPATRQR